MLNYQMFYDLIILNNDEFNLDKKINKYKSINTDDIIETAKQIFKIENLSIVILGSCKNITKKEIRQITRTIHIQKHNVHNTQRRQQQQQTNKHNKTHNNNNHHTTAQQKTKNK